MSLVLFLSRKGLLHKTRLIPTSRMAERCRGGGGSRAVRPPALFAADRPPGSGGSVRPRCSAAARGLQEAACAGTARLCLRARGALMKACVWAGEDLYVSGRTYLQRGLQVGSKWEPESGWQSFFFFFSLARTFCLYRFLPGKTH